MSSDPVVVTPAVLAQRPLPDHGSSAEKQERGDVLVVAGTAETPGAARLAGEAALRIGAGRLQIATASATAAALAVAVPEARVISLSDDPSTGRLTTPDQLDAELEQASAVLIGPGTSRADAWQDVVRRAADVLERTGGVLVLDAGALTTMAEERSLLEPLGERAVVMPNRSEAALLLGPDAGPADGGETEDLETVLRTAVERVGCVVTVRGADTWTAGPTTPAFVDRLGPPGLGTSGSGDVLAGLIAGLAARGAPAIDAVLWATHVHAAAGRRCAARLGPLGFLARDLLDEVPPAVVELSA
jgi:hydroxyethylthiazole kinase-like uncharacterized protein yjeF